MSDDEDDNVPFFEKRATFFPKVSAEEFQSVSKLLSEKTENKVTFPDIEKVPIKKAKPGRGLIKLMLEPEEKTKTEKECRKPTRANREVALPAASRRRLKKFREEQANELKLIETLNRQVLKEADRVPTLHEVEEVFKTSPEKIHALLTFTYMCKKSRLRCYENEKFSTILPRIADLFQLKASEVLLCLPDRNIRVDDTPKSLNLTLDDTIDLIPYKAGENAKKDDDRLKIFFQSNDSKIKIDLLIHKLEKFQEVMEQYSVKKGVPLSKLTFEFDGERLDGTETPIDLDMESGNCVDVKVVAASPIKVNAASSIEADATSSGKVDVISLVQQIPIPKTRGRGRRRGRGRGRKSNTSPTPATQAVFDVDDDTDNSDVVMWD